jgi:acetyltransferase-like isoleucine patch superfamily enzyme
MNPYEEFRESLRQWLRRPSGVTMGRGSSVMRPWRFLGANGVSIGTRTHVQAGGYWECAARGGLQGTIVVGDDVFIGFRSFITAVSLISIGDDCVLSSEVYLADLSHGLDPRAGPILMQELESKGPTRLGRGCFLGYRAAVLPGVTLGDHCVVGTNSTVTRSFPAYSMVAGSPARLIKRFSQQHGVWIKVEREDE